MSSSGTKRSQRGGYYGSKKADIRSADKYSSTQTTHSTTAGFSVCSDPYFTTYYTNYHARIFADYSVGAESVDWRCHVVFFSAQYQAAFSKPGFFGITDSFSGTEWCGRSGAELFAKVYSTTIAGKSPST